MYISLNGELINSKKNLISANGEGFNYGYGLFETIKLVDGKLFFIEDHFERFKKGCFQLNINLDYDLETIKDFVNKLVLSNKIFTGSVKMLYAKNINQYDLLITIKENYYTEDKYKKGFKICFAQSRRNPYSKLTYIKSNNYIENILEKDAALKNGYNEAIFLNIDDNISEGTYTNIFFVKDTIVYTPSIPSGILPGIMRDKIIELIKLISLELKVGTYTKKDLLNADEIFLTNSLMEIMPVSKVEDKELNLASNKITKLMRGKFFSFYY